MGSSVVVPTPRKEGAVAQAQAIMDPGTSVIDINAQVVMPIGGLSKRLGDRDNIVAALDFAGRFSDRDFNNFVSFQILCRQYQALCHPARIKADIGLQHRLIEGFQP